MDTGCAIKIVVLFLYVLLIDVLSGGTPWDQDHTDFVTFNPVCRDNTETGDERERF